MPKEWDPQKAKKKARRSYGSIDCTAAAKGLDEALACQGWELTGYRLWWEPGFTPNSHISVIITAQWNERGEPRAPWIKARTYEANGLLHNIDDVSPWAEYDLPSSIPPDLDYTETVHLNRSGPKSVPGRIEFKPARGPARATNHPDLAGDDILDEEQY